MVLLVKEIISRAATGGFACFNKFSGRSSDGVIFSEYILQVLFDVKSLSTIIIIVV